VTISTSPLASSALPSDVKVAGSWSVWPRAVNGAASPGATALLTWDCSLV
jgi:hypothetical protein